MLRGLPNSYAIFLCICVVLRFYIVVGFKFTRIRVKLNPKGLLFGEQP